jgi:hypothetical protein
MSKSSCFIAEISAFLLFKKILFGLNFLNQFKLNSFFCLFLSLKFHLLYHFIFLSEFLLPNVFNFCELYFSYSLQLFMHIRFNLLHFGSFALSSEKINEQLKKLIKREIMVYDGNQFFVRVILFPFFLFRFL